MIDQVKQAARTVLSVARAFMRSPSSVAIDDWMNREPEHESLPDHIAANMRRYPPARIVLSPASELSTLRFSRKCTFLKVFRPGDNGPDCRMYHVCVDPDQWHTVPVESLQHLAGGLNVEFDDLRKAVDKLCGATS